MISPKIEVCIEGYNIEQTDFYIAHILDKYNSLNELYQKSCEQIVFLEKECKNGFIEAVSESEKRINNKLDLIENRLSAIENILETCNKSALSLYSNESQERFKAELTDFHSELEDIKLIFKK